MRFVSDIDVCDWVEDSYQYSGVLEREVMVCPVCGKTLLWTDHKMGGWYETKMTQCERCRTEIVLNYSDNPSVRKMGWKRNPVPAMRAEDV